MYSSAKNLYPSSSSLEKCCTFWLMSVVCLLPDTLSPHLLITWKNMKAIVPLCRRNQSFIMSKPMQWERPAHSYTERHSYHKHPLGGRTGVLDPAALQQLQLQCENEKHYKSRLKGYKESEWLIPMSISSSRIFITVCIFISTWIKELMRKITPLEQLIIVLARISETEHNY